MDSPSPSPIRSSTRRSLLASLGSISTLGVTGCLQEAQSALGRDPGQQIELTIKTVPADRDRQAVEIARKLKANLEAVGINSDIVLLRKDELRRQILINHDFDVYVARSPDIFDPDELRPLMHSRFNEDPGWLNPFGLGRLDIDELLDAQRTQKGSDRRESVFDLLQTVATLQPFSVLGFPVEIRTHRRDRFEGWSAFPLRDPLGILALEPVSDTDNRLPQLRLVITDSRVTKNFNPIAVEFRNWGTFTGLVYDPLGRRYRDQIRPWAAREWTWMENSRGTTAKITLRDGLQFHDGTALTAEDVAFTYRFLADTALGSTESPVPAPRFQGRVSLVSGIEVIDERTIRLEFGETTPEIARLVFTVPVLPAHEWEPRAREVELVGLTPFEGVTDALVWSNQDPVGSGPFRFDRSVTGELLTLRRFEDHFLHRETADSTSSLSGEGAPAEEVTALVAPASGTAVELVAAGEADAVLSALDPENVPRVGSADDLQLVLDQAESFYHVGFNTRTEVLGNARFRRTIARLLDPSAVATNVFDGYFKPSSVPIRDSKWTPTELEWTGIDPEVPFLGDEGNLDTAAARDAFLEAGFRYNERNELVS